MTLEQLKDRINNAKSEADIDYICCSWVKQMASEYKNEDALALINALNYFFFYHL